jgi:3-deoxy-D-manno-octulosonate 8-phosphate phosphatase (KDO 8-P phosphatase)
MSSSNLQLLILDVDGVLTDGSLFFDDAGGQMRRFHISDGLGIKLWRALGRKTAILTSKESKAVQNRAEMLGIDLLEQGAENKKPGLQRILAASKVDPEQAVYVGDDLQDIPVMRQVGFPVAVANAADEVKAVARYVTGKPGGSGAVREVVEYLLKQDHQWHAALEAAGLEL